MSVEEKLFCKLVMEGTRCELCRLFTDASQDKREQMLLNARDLYCSYANRDRDRDLRRVYRVICWWVSTLWDDGLFEHRVAVLVHLKSKESVRRLLTWATPQETRDVTKFRYQFAPLVRAWHYTYGYASTHAHLAPLAKRLEHHREKIERLFLFDFGNGPEGVQPFLVSVHEYAHAAELLMDPMDEFVAATLDDIFSGDPPRRRRRASALEITRLHEEMKEAIYETLPWDNGIIPMDLDKYD